MSSYHLKPLHLLSRNNFFNNPWNALLYLFRARFPEVFVVFDANMNDYLNFLKNVIYNKIIIAKRLLVVYNNTSGHILKQGIISKQIALFTTDPSKEGECYNSCANVFLMVIFYDKTI